MRGNLQLSSTDGLIRFAVICTLIGLASLLPVLLIISATAVGLYMLGSLLITLGIVLYIVAVIRELRRHQAL